VLILCILSCFSLGDYLRVTGMPDLRGDHGAAVVNWGRATESRGLIFGIIWFWFNVIQKSGHTSVILRFYIL
jgi:hypothetical protein